MNAIVQGQIWIAELPPPINQRPVLVLTRTAAIPHLQNVTIATISRRVRGIDTEVELTTSDGIKERCAVSLDNILTIPKPYLDVFVVELSAVRMAQVFEALKIALDIP